MFLAHYNCLKQHRWLFSFFGTLLICHNQQPWKEGQKKPRNGCILLSCLLSCICTHILSAAVNSIDWPLNRNLWALQSSWLRSLTLFTYLFAQLMSALHAAWMRQEDLRLPRDSRCNRRSCRHFLRCQPNVHSCARPRSWDTHFIMCQLRGVPLQYKYDSATFLKQFWQLSCVP